jgi:hypothetical protein
MNAGEVIAERELTDDAGHVVMARVGSPKKHPDRDWVCAYEILGFEKPICRLAGGVDAFQALLMAIDGIRIFLAQSGMTLTWEGGESGDSGFPRFVPTFFGLAFRKELEGMIESKTEEFAKRLLPPE